MSRGVNKVILIGNLGKEPEVKATAIGKEMATFSIATSKSWKDKASGEWKSLTEWHNIVCFDHLANICKAGLNKGSKVFIEGELKTDKYVGKDGTNKSTTKIVAHEIEVLAGKSESGLEAFFGPGTGTAIGDELPPKLPLFSEEVFKDDDLPF